MALAQFRRFIHADSISRTCPGDRSSISVWHTNAQNDGWSTDEFTSSELHESTKRWNGIADESQVCIVLASANNSRLCETCKNILSTTFSIPDVWWSGHYRNSNGYFGTDDNFDEEEKKMTTTWAFFETKQLEDPLHYRWMRINVFSQWIEATKQMRLVLFDLDQSIKDQLLPIFTQVRPSCLADPFWPYIALSEEVARLQDDAVWKIRNQVRALETHRHGPKPEPEYRRLHDLARHAIHVSESLDVALRSLDTLNLHHQNCRSTSLDINAWTHVNQRLLVAKQLVNSLGYRAVSNEKRLQNEIHLATSMVAHYNAELQLRFTKATMADSAAMRTIATLTLIFLPPTFICALFSMSFFNYDVETGWTVSSQFWMYWAYAVPFTLVISIVGSNWQNLIDFYNRFGKPRRNSSEAYEI